MGCATVAFEPNEVFSINREYRLVNCLYQSWVNQSFSYMETPRPNYGIMLVVQGEITFRWKNGTTTARSGDVVFIPKNAKYKAVIEKRIGMVYNYLINFEMTDFEIKTDFLMPHKTVNNAQFKYADIFQKLTENYLNNGAPDFKVKAGFYTLLDNLKTDIMYPTSFAQGDILAKAKKMLTDTERSISDIAKECCISESGLRSKFAKVFGISPIRLRILAKMNKAKYLLQSTDMTNKEIADSLSFFDEAYFCKVFFRHVGCSPKNYRKNKRL